MSEPRHATVWLVLALLGLLERPEESFEQCACAPSVQAGIPPIASGATGRLREGILPPQYRITCDRCAIIVDAALEGVKPFPFSLPGVPDEVLR